jgi:2-dehydro-3-deoxyphosphogalactonate aldolase
MKLEEALGHVPLIAILRGIRPEEIIDTAEALLDAGIRVVEVPLNSPSPLESIRILASQFKGSLVAGAGTVLSPEDVEAVAQVGGEIIVSPHADMRVIARAIELGCTPFPGIFTPTEAFTAISAGARFLKLFPASTGGPAHLRAMKAILPSDVRVYAVGGVGPDAMESWREAGAAGFGLGSELYRPGQAPEITREKAQLAAQKALSAKA